MENMTAEFLLNVKPENIHIRRCDKSGEDCNWRKKRQKHKFFELIYALNAQAEIELPDRLVKLNPNDMILYPPNVSHKEIPNTKHVQQIISMAVDVECEVLFETGIHISDVDGILGWLFENCNNEFSRKKENYIQLVQSYVNAIFIHAGRYVSAGGWNKGDLLSQCTEYIRKHYNENISISLLESVFCVSASYISRLFSKKYKMGAMQYVNKCRINEAKKLLANDKYSVSMIAAKVGFKDPLYFSRAFKKQEGMSPLQYRKSIILSGEVVRK